MFSIELAFKVIFLPDLIFPPSFTILLAVKDTSPTASIVANNLLYIFPRVSMSISVPAQIVLPTSLTRVLLFILIFELLMIIPLLFKEPVVSITTSPIL